MTLDAKAEDTVGEFLEDHDSDVFLVLQELVCGLVEQTNKGLLFVCCSPDLGEVQIQNAGHQVHCSLLLWNPCCHSFFYICAALCA